MEQIEIVSNIRSKIASGIHCQSEDFNLSTQLANDFLNFSFLNEFIHETTNELIIAEEITSRPLSHKIKNPLNCDLWQLSLEHICLKKDVFWNYTHPYASFDYTIAQKKCRVTLIHFSSLNSKYSRMFIRFFHSQFIELDSFTQDKGLINSLKNLVTQKSNILIAGATGSGKTTFLNALIENIDNDEHIIAIEDTKELKLPAGTSSFMSKSEKNFTMNDYMKYAMRMSPDRIIIGEMRSHEIVTYLLALNTGHSGCLSTIHANSAIDAIDRMCLLFNIYNETTLEFSTLKKLIANSIDYIIYLKNKEIVQVVKILGSENERVFTDIIYNSSEDLVLN